MENPELVARQDFAAQLKDTCTKFHLLQAMVRQDVALTCMNIDRRLQLRAPLIVMTSLAQSVLFEASRIHRSLEHGKKFHFVSNDDRKRFMRELESVVDVRDVNEHGADHHRKGGADPIRPSMHTHQGGGITMALDERSLIILGEDRIMMGPINLADIARTLEELRSLAGFRAIDPPKSPPPHVPIPSSDSANITR